MLSVAVMLLCGVLFADCYAQTAVHESDTTVTSGRGGLRKSHYYNSGGLPILDTKHDETDYAKSVVLTEGNGLAYVTTTPSAVADPVSRSVEIEWNCGGVMENHKASHYFFAEPENGWYFKQWTFTYSDKDNMISTNNPHQEVVVIPYGSRTEYDYVGHSDYEDLSTPYTVTATALFMPVLVNSVSPSSVSVAPTNSSERCEDYSGKVVFSLTGADSMDDFEEFVPAVTGNGEFSFDTKADFSKRTVTVNWSFHGNGTYGKGVTRNRQNRAALTLSSVAGSGSPLTQTCNITADYPNVELSGNDVNIVTTSGAAPIAGTALVRVRYADDSGDFNAFPTSLSDVSGSAGTWTIGAITLSATDYTTGYSTLSIPYTFTPSAVGTSSGSLTLAANAAAGGTALTIGFSATVDGVAAGEASVNDVTYPDFESALSAANATSNATVKLLKNVELSSTAVVASAMTIDLNGFELGSFASKAVEVTGGAALTMQSSRGNGRLIANADYAGRLSAVEVTSGRFVLSSGEIVATNSNSGTSSSVQAVGVYVGASAPAADGRPTTSVQISGGSITVSRTAGSYAYGVLCEEGGAANLSGGVISAVAAVSEAYGVALRGASPVKNMEISATAASGACAVFVNSGSTVVVEGGRYAATASGTEARALTTLGNTRVTDGSFVARSSAGAYAIDVEGGTAVISAGEYDARVTGSEACGLRIAAGSASVHGGTFVAQAQVSDARGVSLATGASLTTTGGSFNANIDRTGADANDGRAYALYGASGSSAELKNTAFKAVTTNSRYAYGAYSEGAVKAEGASFAGDSKLSHAFGLYVSGGATLKSCRFTSVASGSNAIALYADGSTVTVSGASVMTSSGSNDVCGVLASSGELLCTGATVSASAETSAVNGVQVNSGASATLANNIISATGATANAVVNNGVVAISDGTASGDLYALYAGTTSTQTMVNAGHFSGGTAAFAAAAGARGVVFAGGHYNTNAGLEDNLKAGYNVYDIPFGSADYSAGYRYSVGVPSAPGIVVCRNVQTGVEYNTLVDALLDVANGETIVLTHDYTLPAGDYILPAGATLLIPFYESQSAPVKNSITLVVRNSPVSPDVPSPLYTLTFAEGANLTVRGDMETSGQLTSAGGSLENKYITGATCGKYGYIYMNENSNIKLENGANFWCWGYVSGNGRVDVGSGANVHEPFVLGWWKGGSAMLAEINNFGAKKIFPFTDYYYQNIEVPVRYHPGALAFATGGIHVALGGFDIDARATVQLVGTMEKLNGSADDNGLFLMKEGDTRTDSWVEKVYHADKDSIDWVVNSGANISNLLLDLGITMGGFDGKLDTKYLNLPIGNNMTITVNYGRVEIMQDIVFLPGSKMDIHKEATVYIAGETGEDAGDGKSIYLYDADEWMVANGGRYYVLPKYSPTWGTANPRIAKGYDETTPLPDAEMFVHGRFEIPRGAHFYTTAGGANIHSTNSDAGMVLFSEPAPAAGEVDAIYQWTETPERYTEKDASAAQLKNADGTYAQTVGTDAYQLWGYKNNHWVKMAVGALTEGEDACNCFYSELDETGALTGVHNVYPSAFLEVEPNENGDHAYHAADNPSHYIINTGGSIYQYECVWWDAEPVGDDCYMITKESSELYGAYYSYDEDVMYWVPRENRVEWYNTNGEDVTFLGYNNVAYNAVPKYSGKVYNESDELTMQPNPTQAGDATFDYFWDGWVTNEEDWNNPDCRILSNDDMPVSIVDVEYYAHFNKVMKQYSVTFLNEDGTLIEEKTVDAGTMPVCSAEPTKESTLEYDYTLVWTPALSAVTAPVTYRASFDAATRRYTVTFANYNGDVLKRSEVDYGTDLSVAANLDAVKPADPTRQNDGFFSYNFRGWSPAPTVVTGAVTLTAVFDVTDWTPEYEITFLDYDGTTLQTQYVRHGNSLTDPSLSQVPERDEDETGTYTFSGWSPALVSVPTENATYTAQYDVTPKTYNILFKDYDGTVLKRESALVGGTMPTPPAAPSRTASAQYSYTFTGWNPALTAAAGDAVYTAQYSETLRTYTVRFLNWDGTVLATQASVVYGATPSYSGATPTKPADGYTTYSFDYWYPSLTAVTANRDYTATYRSYTRNMEVYTRTVAADMFGTICLPYAVEADGISAGVEIWDAIGYGDESGTLLLYERAGSMEAGKAYVFYSPSTEVSFTYEVTGAPAAAKEGYPLKGFIGADESEIKYLSTNDYALHAEGWMRVTGNDTDWILSNRAYLRLSYLAPYAPLSPAAAARTRTARIFKAADTATDIQSGNEAVSGGRPEKVLKDGHLYIIMPDGTTFSATGERIK